MKSANAVTDPARGAPTARCARRPMRRLKPWPMRPMAGETRPRCGWRAKGMDEDAGRHAAKKVGRGSAAAPL